MNDFRDFEQAEFEIVRRGYEPGAVDAYLSELRAELERLGEQEPGDVPGDGSYPEPVQAELDRVTIEVEAIIAAARQAAEGLRTRAAAEASRWREEASSDARRWRSEAEESSTRLRSDAETSAERMLAEAQEESTKRRTEADAHVARVREEADAYALQTRQVAESEAAQLTDEADAYSTQARTVVDAYALQTRQVAESEAAQLTGEADAYSTQARTVADAYASQTREAADVDTANLRSEAETEATRLRDQANAYSREVRVAATSEAEQLSSDVQAAAETIQTAAENYASTVRLSAEAEAARQLTEARTAAEIARASVWDQSTAILEAVGREIREARTRGENEALAIIAEAERQSHRLVSQARHSTEEQRRAARIEAERLVGDAQARHDEIIEVANRTAASAQERAQALERRREELMGQLEKAQAAMRTMEDELETRRGSLRDRDVLADSSTVKIVPRTEPEERDGVKIIPPSGAPTVKSGSPRAPVSAEEIMDEVRALREERESIRVELVPRAPVQVEPVTVVSETREPTPPSGDIDALFANLRGSTQSTKPRTAPAVDPDVLRERLLLPLQNRAHRLVKKELTELQNLTLEQLRVAGDDWIPNAGEHGEAFGPAIAELVLESARSGYLAAAEFGIRADGPPDIVTDNPDTQVAGFASDLTDAVAHVLDISRSSGETSRKTSAAASRVYREWRTDGAALRLREISDVAYADALRTALRLEGIEDTEWALGDWATARHAS